MSPPAKIQSRQKPTTNEHLTHPHRFGRHPGEQGARHLVTKQDRVEKWPTVKHANTRYITRNTNNQTGISSDEEKRVHTR